MKEINKLKKIEKSVLILLINFFIFIKKEFLNFFKFILNISKQNVTILFIPHSEKKVFNLRVNLFIIFSLTFLIILIISLLVGFAINFYIERENFFLTKTNIENFEKKSKIYEQIINDILENHAVLKRELNKLLSEINPDVLESLDKNSFGAGGPLNLNNDYFENENLPGNEKINDILKDYSYSIQAFSELNKMARNYKKLFKDIPFGSPVKGSYIFTSGFGFRIHPIHKVLDMHQGIDLAWLPGTPVVATAPGVVEKVEYNPDGYGWYCKISHKLGFSTLYAHLISAPIVRPGDKVQKGQIVGYMGGTGATTGVHLHYEIHLGGNLKDPWQFVIGN